MPGLDAAKLTETRAKVLTESLETSNEPKFGYFGFPGPLCIGDDSYGSWLMKKAAPKETGDGEPIRNIQSAPTKKGMHPNVFFSFEPPLCIGDPYVTRGLNIKKEKVWMVDPDAAFKPPGKIKQANKLGYEYVNHMDGVKDPKAVKEALQGVLPLRQIYGAPTKKGGGGVLTNGVLMGWPENDNKALPEHMPDDYDAARKERKAELEKHKSLLQETAFRSMAYGNNNFSSNTETFGCTDKDGNRVPTHVPRDPEPDLTKPYPHEAAFRPGNPMKKGILKGCCSEFPQWEPDPMPGSNVQRKPKPEGDVPPAFKVGAPQRVHKPTPSVTTLTRNMRNERPSSFARPLL